MDKKKVRNGIGSLFQQETDGAGQLVLTMWTANGFIPVGVFDDQEGLDRVKLVITNAMLTYARGT